MSLSLRPDQRWFLECDALDCPAHIIATEAPHADQRVELATLAAELGWRRTTDVGDYCHEHAATLAPPIPRDELCRRDTWCVGRDGHAGKCLVAPKRAMPPVDLTHRTVKKRWG